ncbi:Disease resistance protein [Corchorus olitorius]|uniref:Disease resistance protein n=1 Tax=Corchorus olitorius TaxID=93759 RepID=A0A1R3JVT6_9ROSI|nr:Disease resistance protein [Corchorus olitorius]
MGIETEHDSSSENMQQSSTENLDGAEDQSGRSVSPSDSEVDEEVENFDGAQDRSGRSVSRSDSEVDEEVEYFDGTQDQSRSDGEVDEEEEMVETEHYLSPTEDKSIFTKLPTSSTSSAATIFEEDSSNIKELQASPTLRRTYSAAQPQLKKRLSRKSSNRQLSDPTEDYTTNQPNDSEQKLPGNKSGEKSVTVVFEDLLNMLAKPVVSKRKLRRLMLKAEVSSPGKEILLWTIYNAEGVKQQFQFRAWINVSQVSTEIDVVNAILQKPMNDNEEARRMLRDFLLWRRFLIVLSGNQADLLWGKLKSDFPHSLDGSRVILALPQIDGSTSSENTHVYLADDSNVRSAKAVIHELTEAILRSRRRLLFLISVVGLVGAENTSLLWPIYDAQDVKQHFDCRAWVQVAQVLRIDDVLAKIFEQVTNIKMEADTRPSREQLQQRLHNFLSKKRYLVVLYSVWTAEIWNKLKACFPNTLNGSRVILAVDSIDVARRTNSWIFSVTPGKELSDDLKDMQANVSSGERVKRWVNLADIKDEASEMVGLDDTVEQLAEVALDNCKTAFVISVLGVPGSGKTTLVRTFYNSRATKQHFDCRAWVSVPQNFDEKDILLDLFRQLRKAKEKQSLSLEQLKEGIQNYLTWKRYLIVLDDVRSSDIWKTLSLDIQNSSSSSKVILTTRNPFLAHHISGLTMVIQQRLLNRDESWQLFKKVVKIHAEDPGLLNLKEKILRRCRGVPLQMVLLGGLLSTKNSYDEWPAVIEQTSQKIEKKKEKQDEDQLKSSGQLPPLNAKQNGAHNKLDSKQKEEKISVDNQPNSLAQLGTKQKEEHGKQNVTEQATSSSAEDQSNSKLEQQPLDIKRKEEKGKMVVVYEDERAGGDQETSSSHMASSSNPGMEASLGEIQSTSSGGMPWQDIGDVLAYYRVLPNHLKCCLLYLGLFPDKHEISIRRLLLLWLAEGLVIPSSDGKTPLEEAMRYFEELKTLGIIQITDGKPKKCEVQTSIRDKLFPTAQKVGFFHFHTKSGASPDQKKGDDFTVRRLAESDEMYIHTNPHDHCLRHLRCYISFYQKKGDAPTSGVNNLLKKIVDRGAGSGMLVTLDLEGVYKPVLPEKLGNLIFLKYLSLRGTHLDSIPDSVGNLPSLETLDIKHTYIITLPSTIWKAKKLQHLYTSEIYVDLSIEKELACGVNNLKTCVPMGESSGSTDALKDLQTLWGLVIRESIDKENWLSKVRRLRKVKLTFHEESSQVLASWLSKQTNLQSLKLRCITESNKPATLQLGPVMTASSNLKQLYLVGKLPEETDFSKLPQGLEILTLSVSCLEVDPMEMLGKLKELKVLRLYANSFRKATLKCHRDGFPKLRILKLWMLPKLEEWIVDEDAMPELKEVEIRYCKHLKKVEGLKELTKLTDLILTNMTDEFFNHVKENVDTKVLITQNSLTFNPPWQDDQESNVA